MQLLKIEGTRQLRLLPWRYDTPGFCIRQFKLREKGKQAIQGLSPGTYAAPDPLWDARYKKEEHTGQWEGYALPYYDSQKREFGFVRLPRTLYEQIVQRMAGTMHPHPNADLILERINEMPGSITLAQALADAYAQSECGWLEEPCDVTDLDDGCDIIVRKMGHGLTTRWELTFHEPKPLIGMDNAIKNIMEPSFDVLEALEFGPFNLEGYLKACRQSNVEVAAEVLAQLEKLGQ